MKPRTCATSASRGSGKEVTGRDGGVIVALKLIDEKDFEHRGNMDFVDNVIDRSSGTIRGRAVFANPDGGADARHVRTHPRAGLAALQRAAGAGRRDRHRAGRASSCWWSTTTTPRVQKYVTLGPLSDDNLRVIKDGPRRPTTASSSTA